MERFPLTRVLPGAGAQRPTSSTPARPRDLGRQVPCGLGIQNVKPGGVTGTEEQAGVGGEKGMEGEGTQGFLGQAALEYSGRRTAIFF